MNFIKKIIKFPIIFCRKIRNFFFIKRFFGRNKQEVIVWIYPHIGDMFYGLLYIQQLKLYHKIDKIGLIGNEKYSDLYKLFNGIDNFHLMSEKKVWRFAYSSCGYFAKKLIGKYIAEGRFYTNDFTFYNKITPPYPDEGLLSYTKRIIYNLPEECNYCKPIFPERELNGYDYSKMVVVSPHAKSVSLIAEDFFVKLVNSLKQRGYDVYTNVAPNEEEIVGTKRLECSLLDLVNIMRRARGFIGLRSGICDLIAMTDVPMYVLFNNYSLGKFATLLDYRKDIKEYYGQDYDFYLGAILGDFENAN